MRFILLFILLCTLYSCRSDIPSYVDNEFAEFEVSDDSFTADNIDSILENAQKVKNDPDEEEEISVNNEVK